MAKPYKKDIADPNNFIDSPEKSRWGEKWLKENRLVIAILVGTFVVWIIYYNQQCIEKERQEFAGRPHTVHVLDYQISFPKQLPPGYEAGFVDIDYFNNFTSSGEGRTRIAKWFVYESHHQTDLEDGMQFMVNNFGEAGAVPIEWLEPPAWKDIIRTEAGTKEVSGLKFAITRWTAEQTDPLPKYKISGIDYIAHDNGKIIALRGYNSFGKDTIILLTDSVLNTFRKVKKVIEPKEYSLGDGYKSSDSMTHTGNDDKFKDPYAELVQP